MMRELYAPNYPQRRLEALFRSEGQCEHVIDGKRCPNRLGTFKISHAGNACFEQLFIHHPNHDPWNRGSRSKWTGSNGKMMKQLVEPVHGYESQPQRVCEPSFSPCVSNDLNQPVEAIENMHTLNDLSLTLIPAHLLREPQRGASTCTAHSSVG